MPRTLGLGDLLLVSSSKFRHAVVGKVDRRHLARIHSGAEAFLVVPAVNPAIRNAMPVRRLMVMKHALCNVQDFILGNSAMRQCFKHVLKVAVIGFITANILGSYYRVKGNAKAVVGA